MATGNKLFLIDGSSFLYRAYYGARKNFTTKDGLPTGATFIITRMLRNLLNANQHHKFVVVFDAHGPSFRQQMYPEYKATRPSMPDDLRVQIQVVHAIVKAMGFPLVAVPGVEADDVLGSYAKTAVAAGYEVIIATGDKDLAQLVSDADHVSLLDTMKDISYDEANVKDKFGVPPELIIDLLALKGDSADNIPGMKGVGEKTALAVLNQLGGIFYIKDHLDEATQLDFRGAKKFKENFLANWPMVELSYRLATIKCDVPLPIPLEELAPPVEDSDTLIALFERLEFRSFAYKERQSKGVNGDSHLELGTFESNQAPSGMSALAKKKAAVGLLSEIEDDADSAASTTSAANTEAHAASTTNSASTSSAVSSTEVHAVEVSTTAVSSAATSQSAAAPTTTTIVTTATTSSSVIELGETSPAATHHLHNAANFSAAVNTAHVVGTSANITVTSANVAVTTADVVAPTAPLATTAAVAAPVNAAIMAHAEGDSTTNSGAEDKTNTNSKTGATTRAQGEEQARVALVSQTSSKEENAVSANAGEVVSAPNTSDAATAPSTGAAATAPSTGVAATENSTAVPRSNLLENVLVQGERVLANLSQHHLYADVSKYQGNFKLVTTDAELQELAQILDKSPQVGLYVESNHHAPTDGTMLGMAVALPNEQGYYIPLLHSYIGVPVQITIEQIKATLGSWLQSTESQKIAYNMKRVHLFFHFAGMKLRGMGNDPMIMAHNLNSSSEMNIGALAHSYLHYHMMESLDVLANREMSLSSVEVARFATYACERALVSLQLHQICYEELASRPHGLETLVFDTKVLEVLYAMEKVGTYIDGAELGKQGRSLKETLFVTERRIYDLAGHTFNLNSPKQLGQVLFDELAIPYPKKTVRLDKFGKKSYSTADEILSEVDPQYEIVSKVQRYRQISKLISTYADKLTSLISPYTGRVHTNFNEAGTVTGRLSSSEPNLQNIPTRTKEGKQIRCSFAAPPGYKIVSADYSQIELRLIAHFSEDQNLIDAFMQHHDIHRVTAAQVLGKKVDKVTDEERMHAKTINFGLMYGMKHQKLARQTGMTPVEAKEYINKYFAQYPSIKNLMERIISQARQTGYVETLLGHRIYIKGIESTGVTSRTAERAAINAPMQGSAADIIKKAMVDIFAYLQTLPEDSVHLTLQVHDELVFEVRDDLVVPFCFQVKKIMENVVKLRVPLEVSVGIGNNWADAH